jgi:hypothetical protein
MKKTLVIFVWDVKHNNDDVTGEAQHFLLPTSIILFPACTSPLSPRDLTLLSIGRWEEIYLFLF